ncbi:glycosyltransferase family 4 protein [Nocardioides acrostichi]|uniref:Glycosyltransferase family 4 protein n=1 Tax=Nocardioides acrostichi TaxID=2784339 RepID=A0A930Y673_9ACTN|nr:glycosyltransferase family 4 protein [Nocardioides acrostichi]MBF4162035.1 glycosyltransferase family 4 protein [Nocardioides acrostichi]
MQQATGGLDSARPSSTRSLSVLLLAQFYPPVIGGEERHVRNLAVALAARGLDVHVATLGTDFGEPQRDPGVTVHELDSVGRKVPALYPTADRPLSLPVPDPITTRALARVRREVQPDVVHSHNWLVNSWLALPSAYRTPLVHSLHDYSHVCATKRLVFADDVCPGPTPRRCIPCVDQHYGRGRGQVIWGMVRAGIGVRERAVDLFTPVSSFVARANRLQEAGVAWRTVPNFVPDDLTARPRGDRLPGLPAGEFLFFAGDLSRQKGVHTLVRAWRRIKQLHGEDAPDLVLAGRPADGLEGVPETAADGLHVHHYWDHENVVNAFQHCVAAVLPSEWPDPCPTTVLEAMALGSALVTTQQGGIADMVTGEESALVVRPGSVDDIVEAVGRLRADDGLRRRLAAQASVEVGDFLQGQVAEDLHGIYEELATRRSAGAAR